MIQSYKKTHKLFTLLLLLSHAHGFANSSQDAWQKRVYFNWSPVSIGSSHSKSTTMTTLSNNETHRYYEETNTHGYRVNLGYFFMQNWMAEAGISRIGYQNKEFRFTKLGVRNYFFYHPYGNLYAVAGGAQSSRLKNQPHSQITAFASAGYEIRIRPKLHFDFNVEQFFSTPAPSTLITMGLSLHQHH